MIITVEEAILNRKNFEGARKQWIFTYCSGYQEKKKRKILFLQNNPLEKKLFRKNETFGENKSNFFHNSHSGGTFKKIS